MTARGDVSRAEVCAVAVAEAFRGDGEILASCFGTIPAIAARLAKGELAVKRMCIDTMTEQMQPLEAGAVVGDAR